MSVIVAKGYKESTPMYCGTSSSVVKDSIVCYDVSTGAAVSPVIPATAALLAKNIAGIAVNTPAAGDYYVNVIPAVPGQVVEYDCTSNTSTAMLGKVNDLTDSVTVANSTTISTAATGFVVNLEVVGAASDKKMRGLLLGAQCPAALS